MNHLFRTTRHLEAPTGSVWEDPSRSVRGPGSPLSIEQTGPMSAVAATDWRRLTQRYIELEAESLDKRVTRPPGG